MSEKIIYADTAPGRVAADSLDCDWERAGNNRGKLFCIEMLFLGEEQFCLLVMPRNTPHKSDKGLVVRFGQLEIMYEIFDADSLRRKTTSDLFDSWKGYPLWDGRHLRHRCGCAR